jgi:uncharacterized membrane protein YbaN (DUF454 family)
MLRERKPLAAILDFVTGRKMRRTTRIILLACGIFFLLLSILGMFLPVLPTTPFLLLASFCFARSSKRINDWLLSNRWFGSYIRNYREGNGITLRHKLITISLLWITIGYTAWIVSFWWLKLILVCIVFGVSYHLIRIKTFKSSSSKIIHQVRPPSPEEAD